MYFYWTLKLLRFKILEISKIIPPINLLDLSHVIQFGNVNYFPQFVNMFIHFLYLKLKLHFSGTTLFIYQT
jgi:hypothetical protein